MRKFIATLFAIALAAQEAPAALLFHVPPENGADELFRIAHEGGQYTVYASGEIAPGDAQRLRAFLRERQIEDAKIVFNSPGGSLGEGLAVGQVIRELQLDTGVGQEVDQKGATCASACAYAFAGGVYRYYDGKSGRLGIHQFYANSADEMNATDAQLVSGMLVAYLRGMGVDANAFSLATMAGSAEMVWLSAKDAEDLQFANNGASQTTAEIRTIGMRPYLRLDQMRRQGHARVLFTCLGNGKIDLKAGVVANHVDAAFHSSISQRSYIELDGAEALVKGRGGTLVVEDVMWLHREVDNATLAKILKAKELDIWTDGSGAVRWGALMDLRSVQKQLATYVADCRRPSL